MTVREAVIDDVPQLVELGKRFRASSEYRGIVRENPQQMARTAEHLITADVGVVYVSENRGGQLVAMIGLQLFVHPISGDLTAGEAFWWSEVPGQGFRVFLKAREWAKAQGATKLQMIQPLSKAELGDFYDKLGFKCIEVAWELDLEAA